MTVKFIGTGFPESHDYGPEEHAVWDSVCNQVDKKFPNQTNLVISLTWFGPQFENSAWYEIIDFEVKNKKFDNVFILALVDPPYLTIDDIQQIKIKTGALKLFEIGHFDGPYYFNFFSTVIAKKFTKYSKQELVLENVKHLFVNYNRKPKPHRVALVKRLYNEQLDHCGTITLGQDPEHCHDQDPDNNLYITIGEKHKDYLHLGNKPDVWSFGIPQDYYSLHRMDIWKETFLYVNAATEFNPVDNLFIQQDVFKPMIGLRPFVINGVQRTYRWLRANGFKTFNQYWSHIDIENGDVHDTIIELLQWLSKKSNNELVDMYNDMLPDLEYNKNRFFEFSNEQTQLIENLFESSDV